jgi:uncharacterized protein with PQ loop repeat
MEMKDLMQKISMLGGVVLPIWNIPLIVRIIKRKTSEDISLLWLFGVWTCILLMFPSAITSEEVWYRWFGVTNIFFFTLVVVVVMMYRKKS